MVHRPPRAGTVILLVVLIMLTVVGVLQFLLLDGASEAEVARLRRVASTAARQIRGEIAYELTSLITLISSWSVADEPMGQLPGILAAWEDQARFPGLIDQILFVLPNGDDPTGVEYQATVGGMELVRTDAPSWLRVESGPGRAADRFTFSGDDALVIRVPLLRTVRTGETSRIVVGRSSDGPLASFVRLDRTYLSEAVLPTLVHAHLGDDPSGFQAAVIDLSSYEVVYATSSVSLDDLAAPSALAGSTGSLTPNEIVPIFGVSAGEGASAGEPVPHGALTAAAQSPIVQQWLMLRSLGERSSPDDARLIGRERESVSSSDLVLVIWHPAGSVERAAIAQRNQNLFVSFLFLAAFAGAALLFHSLYYRALRQREREQEFVASVTHELRTPVAAMHAVAENLAAGIITREERVREYGIALLDEGRRLRAMIDQTLLYAGLHGKGRLQMEVLDLSRLVRHAVEATPELQSHELTVRVDPDLPPYRGDESAMRSILSNLLSNAGKHTSPGTHVTISVAAEATRRARRIVITVEDTGPGIPRSELKRVREAFFRGAATCKRQVPGTGLGLSIVERLVTMRRGRLSVESGGRDGTRVTVRLPYER